MDSIRPIFLIVGWAIVQSQMCFLNLIKPVGPIWFFTIFIIALVSSGLVSEFEEALQYWFNTLLLTTIFIFFFLSLPTFLQILPNEMIFLILQSHSPRVLVSILFIAPLSLVGCCIGQIIQ